MSLFGVAVGTVEADVAKFNSDLAAAVAKLTPVFNTVTEDAAKVVSFADKELPNVAIALTVLGGILAMIPPTTGVGAAMLAAAAAIKAVEPYVKTLDGELVSLEEARATGHTQVLVPTKADLFRAASSQTQLVTGLPQNTADILTGIAYAQVAKIDTATSS